MANRGFTRGATTCRIPVLTVSRYDAAEPTGDIFRKSIHASQHRRALGSDFALSKAVSCGKELGKCQFGR